MKGSKGIGWLAALGLAAGAGGAVAAAVRGARKIDLRGRVVVITGGGRGLGFGIAEEFLKRGCRLAICGRDGDVIAEAVEAFKRRGGDVLGMACDGSDPAQVHTFVSRVMNDFGTIDILV